MKYLKIFIILTLSIFSLKSEAQKKFSISNVKIGYTPIINHNLFKTNYSVNDLNSESFFVFNLLSDISLNDNKSLKIGLSYSQLNAVSDKIFSNFNESGFWIDTYLEHRIKSKFFQNFYYGISIGYLNGDEDFRREWRDSEGNIIEAKTLKLVDFNPNKELDEYNRIRQINLNICVGAEFNIYKNTKAFAELGYFSKGLLTVGLSQYFINPNNNLIY